MVIPIFFFLQIRIYYYLLCKYIFIWFRNVEPFKVKQHLFTLIGLSIIKLKKEARTVEYEYGTWFLLGLPAHTQTA